jgi:predicted transport protein
MPLYQLKENKVSQIKQGSFPKEKNIQKIFETNLHELLGVRFLASEFTTGDRQRGRIDSLGLDADNNPTIIEYKLTSNENVINQGLFYMDWLLDHKGDFAVITQKVLGPNVAIDWSSPRLILIAESFSEYDKYAVNRIGGNIQLWTYRKYGEDLLYLEPLYINPQQGHRIEEKESKKTKEFVTEAIPYTVEDHLRNRSNDIIELFQEFQESILGLAGEDEILEKAGKIYIAYQHSKNFCEVSILTKELHIWLDVKPDEIDDPYHLSRDVSKIGHHGTGNLEVRLSEISQLDKVMNLVEQSYKLTL